MFVSSLVNVSLADRRDIKVGATASSQKHADFRGRGESERNPGCHRLTDRA